MVENSHLENYSQLEHSIPEIKCSKIGYTWKSLGWTSVVTESTRKVYGYG